MGAIYFGLDQALLAALRRKLPLETFVETGTYMAATTLAVAPLFRHVTTIELSVELHEQARQTLAHLGHVEALQGMSPDVLRACVPRWVGSSVLYWLDAHWCGGVTGGVAQECPLLSELDALASLNEQSVVLIDDARYFLGPPPPPHRSEDWPRLLEVVAALRKISSEHELCVVNDVLIYAPIRVIDDVVAYGRARGIDLVDLMAAVRRSPSTLAGTVPAGGAVVSNARTTGLELGFNGALNTGDRSERIFAFHAKRLGIRRLLDIGANSGQFATKMRRLGFDGVIYSVEPQAAAHSLLRQNTQNDVRWIALPRQAAGRARAQLALNLAENGWSSSFLPTHQNHLSAAPETRTVGHETVSVTMTADLMTESLMKEIDALKIDVQGYELEVLEGLRSCVGGIRLLLLEMSLVECYVGAPDLFALDRTLIEDFGFSRVSLEPSYYDDQNGVVQQFDGIYVRDCIGEAVGTIASTRRFSAVVTSMHGTPTRKTPSGIEIGGDWLEFCIRSWHQQSNHIVSVSEIDPAAPHIAWVETKGRPAIADLLAAVPEEGDEPAILCNADIAIGDNLTLLRTELDPRVLYLAQRIEVEASAANPQLVEAKGVYPWGFDFFILPADFVRFMRKSQAIARKFRIGEPWWDYLLPLIAIWAGFPVKRLPPNEPFALHYTHETRYRHETWLELGADFFHAVASLGEAPSPRDNDLLHDLLSLHGSLEDRLKAASTLVSSRLG